MAADLWQQIAVIKRNIYWSPLSTVQGIPGSFYWSWLVGSHTVVSQKYPWGPGKKTR